MASGSPGRRRLRRSLQRSREDSDEEDVSWHDGPAMREQKASEACCGPPQSATESPRLSQLKRAPERHEDRSLAGENRTSTPKRLKKLHGKLQREQSNSDEEDDAIAELAADKMPPSPSKMSGKERLQKLVEAILDDDGEEVRRLLALLGSPRRVRKLLRMLVPVQLEVNEESEENDVEHVGEEAGRQREAGPGSKGTLETDGVELVLDADEEEPAEVKTKPIIFAALHGKSAALLEMLLSLELPPKSKELLEAIDLTEMERDLSAAIDRVLADPLRGALRSAAHRDEDAEDSEPDFMDPRDDVLCITAGNRPGSWSRSNAAGFFTAAQSAAEGDHAGCCFILLCASPLSAIAQETYVTGGLCSGSVTPLMAAAGARAATVVWMLARLLMESSARGQASGISLSEEELQRGTSHRAKSCLLARDDAGATALHYAAGSGDKLAVHLLLSAAAHSKELHGMPLFWTNDGEGKGLDRQSKEVESGTAREAYPEPPEGADQFGTWSLVRQLLNAADTAGATPLHVAAGQGQEVVIRQLLRWGASPTAEDAQGWTPLLYADNRHETDCVLSLLGACPDTQLKIMGSLLKRNASSKKQTLSVVKMLATVPEFFTFVNRFLKKNPSLLARGQPLHFMREIKGLLDFDNKKVILRTLLDEVFAEEESAAVQGALARGYLGRRVTRCPVVRRGVWASFRRWLRSLTVDQIVQTMRGSFWIIFSGEEGVGPGVNREGIDIIRRELVATSEHSAAPLTLAADGESFLPNTNIRQKALSGHFEDLGLLLAHCHMQHVELNINFSVVLMKAVLAEDFSLDDLEGVDKELYKNLQWLVEDCAAEDVEGLFQTFTVSQGGTEVPLIPHGADTLVTAENREAYVAVRARHTLTRLLAEPAAALRRGLAAVVDRPWEDTWGGFSARELTLLFAGSESVMDDWKVHEWRNATVYQGYEDGDFSALPSEAPLDRSYAMHEQANLYASPQVRMPKVC
eukprot:scaffold7092_cov262-Pinguiococcus_pyrenoidosus.AAC.12